MGELPENWHLISDLAPWERNARAHTDESTRRLVAAIRRFGFLVPITAWRAEKRIAAGHGRRLAMLSILREDPSFVPRNAPTGTLPGMVPVMWEDFASEAQYEAFAISDNRQAKNAQDDGEAIAAILREMDADGLDFAGMGFGDDEIDLLLSAVGAHPTGDTGDGSTPAGEGGDGEQGDGTDESGGGGEAIGGDGTYTNKIRAPIYRPTMDAPPPTTDLFDHGKADELLTEIDRARLPADVTYFLRLAAERHTVFNFRNVAEFYCHATPEVQHLFERSGLVIIDFDKAVENGFVRLTERLAALAGIEQGGADAG
jgi:hypothetical protein